MGKPLIIHVREADGAMLDVDAAACLECVTKDTIIRRIRAGVYPGLTIGHMPRSGQRGRPRNAVTLKEET